ncbi:nonstructural protein [Microviridae sp.]|nr:nonstructural protein [Microviridae sp.]
MKTTKRGQNYGQELIFNLRQKVWNIYAAIRGTYRWHSNTTMYGFIKQSKCTIQQISRRFHVNANRKLGRNRWNPYRRQPTRSYN